MTSTIKEHLIAARALIDTPEKWMKGAFQENNCYCVLGAVRSVDWRGGLEVIGVLRRSLPEYGSVVEFNDDPATTHDDIISLFDRAIAAQEPSHAG